MKKLIFFMLMFILVIPLVNGQDCSPACQPEYASGVCRDLTPSPPPPPPPTNVYHVNPSGSDSNPGTIDSPWKTITKAANTVSAGDLVYVHAGVYREGGIKPANSGTETNPIVFMVYGYDEGNPDEVLITGADIISGWTHYSGNVYYKDPGYTTYQVFQNEEKLRFEKNGRDSLGVGEWWRDGSSNKLYVYVKDKGSGFNPNNYNMEASRRTGGFVLGSRTYVHVKGFQFCCFNPDVQDWSYPGGTYKYPLVKD